MKDECFLDECCEAFYLLECWLIEGAYLECKNETWILFDNLDGPVCSGGSLPFLMNNLNSIGGP